MTCLNHYEVIMKRTITLPPHSKMARPTIPYDSPDFKPTRGADVQATWRRFGWTPIAKEQPEPIVAPPLEEDVTPRRRLRIAR